MLTGGAVSRVTEWDLACAGRRGAVHVPAERQRGCHSSILQRSEARDPDGEERQHPRQTVGADGRTPVVSLQSRAEGRPRQRRPQQQLVAAVRLGSHLTVSVLSLMIIQ